MAGSADTPSLRDGFIVVSPQFVLHTGLESPRFRGECSHGEKLAMGMIVILILVVVLVLWAVGIYNRLVTARNGFKNAFAQIDVQLTRRYDLIPNLVETARGYMKHERETLEAVIAARNSAVAGLKAAAADPGSAAAVAQLSGAEAGLTGALGRLFAVAEAYPDLKANANMMQLSEELTSTENRVAFSRQAFNDAVMAFNNAREVFPNSLIAGFFNFEAAKMLEAPAPEKREAPKVSFG
jgi:LemA protein